MIRQAEERRLHRTGEKIMRIGKISLLMVLVWAQPAGDSRKTREGLRKEKKK